MYNHLTKFTIKYSFHVLLLGILAYLLLIPNIFKSFNSLVVLVNHSKYIQSIKKYESEKQNYQFKNTDNQNKSLSSYNTNEEILEIIQCKLTDQNIQILSIKPGFKNIGNKTSSDEFILKYHATYQQNGFFLKDIYQKNHLIEVKQIKISRLETDTRNIVELVLVSSNSNGLNNE